jgi:ABC-2 type transport system permease protein
MLQTLLVNLKLHFREKAQLFWLFAFPIILATMFNGMFGNIAESYALHTVDVVVVNNDDWRASPGAQMLVDGISSDTGATGADGDHAKVDDDGDAMPKLITVTEAASMEAADRALLDAKAQGRLSVDGSGKLQLAISQATQTSATDVMASSSGLDISLTVLGNIVDLYNRNTAVVVNAAQHNPSALLPQPPLARTMFSPV